jgi:hypothetical protein
LGGGGGDVRATPGDRDRLVDGSGGSPGADVQAAASSISATRVEAKRNLTDRIANRTVQETATSGAPRDPGKGGCPSLWPRGDLAADELGEDPEALVCTGTAVDISPSGIAAEDVRTGSAEQAIGSLAAEQPVRSRSTPDDVRSPDGFGQCAVVPIDRIVTRSTEDAIGSFAGMERVVSRPSDQEVPVGPTEDQVPASPSEELVLGAVPAPTEDVHTSPPEQRVLALIPEERVRAPAAAEVVTTGETVNAIGASQSRDDIPALRSDKEVRPGCSDEGCLQPIARGRGR